MVVDGKQIEVIRTNRIVYNVEIGRATLLERPSDVKIDSLGWVSYPTSSLKNTSPEDAARMILQSMEKWDEAILKPEFGNIHDFMWK